MRFSLKRHKIERKSIRVNGNDIPLDGRKSINIFRGEDREEKIVLPMILVGTIILLLVSAALIGLVFLGKHVGWWLLYSIVGILVTLYCGYWVGVVFKKIVDKYN